MSEAWRAIRRGSIIWAHVRHSATLAEANAYRPSGIFADLFAEMVGRAHRGRGHLCLRPWLFDYGWWAKMNAAGCRIVTRFKTNTPLAVTADLDVPQNGNILSDRIGLLPRRQAKNRKNPFGDPVREVRVKIETGKILRILSNDLNASAQEIAVALIAFLLLRLAQATQKAVQSPLAFARLVRADLMHRRRIDHLRTTPPAQRTNPAQIEFMWAAP